MIVFRGQHWILNPTKKVKNLEGPVSISQTRRTVSSRMDGGELLMGMEMEHCGTRMTRDIMVSRMDLQIAWGLRGVDDGIIPPISKMRL